ncbi:MFS transporter [Streptomyces gilvus]|uniref:MFS transporter n=1 Tax=Streptomyces gilvus TaxID=2920937 RepID=UPI001F1186AE|nr:MFS transporter [Streptomyces sp. CME 23]MCH5677506.1 MFS transporter [Streptomyces sp. CME 23]
MRRRYTTATASYFVGAVSARTGDEMSGPAMMLAGFALTGSTATASSLLAGLNVAAAVGGPLLGAFLDRASRPGRLLACALAGYGAGVAVILLGLGHLPLPVTVLIAVCTGLLGPALSGGWTAQLPRVVPGDALPRANALDAMTFTTASLAGPALAGTATETLGAPTAVAVAVTLIGLATPAAWRLPTAGHRGAAGPGPDSDEDADARAPMKTRARDGGAGVGSRTRSDGQADTGRRAPLTAGLRFIVQRPALARATLTSVLCCAAEGMFTACVPLLGQRALGGSGRGALLLSCTAVASLAANSVLARRPRLIAPDTAIWVGAVIQATALALAVTTHPAVLVTAALLTGIGAGPQLTALFAIRHREAPDHLRGQIFTTGASLKITGFALGAATAGTIAGHSLPGALTLASATAALAAPAYFTVWRGQAEVTLISPSGPRPPHR